MNRNRIYQRIGTLLLAAVAGLTTSCDNNLNIEAGLDTTPYESIYTANAYLRDAQTNLTTGFIELFDKTQPATATLKMGLTKPAGQEATVKVEIDYAYLQTYNQQNDTHYVIYPEDLVDLSNGGKFTLAADATEATMDIVVKLPTRDMKEETYAIPLTLKSTDGHIVITNEAAHFLYVVKDMHNIDNCLKGEELPKGFVYFGTSENPLNALSFQLENGKYIWDYVVLFSGNINMDPLSGRPYLNCNTNTRFLLDNYDTYIKPLRDRGIKVLLCVMGNHDMAGLARLSVEGAKDFAREIYYYIDHYHLDGVNFDDEYSTADWDKTNPAFSSIDSYVNAARLCYEVKQLMPDKIVSVFEWSKMYPSLGFPTIEGKTPGEYVDIVFGNYGTTGKPAAGMTRKNCTGISMEYELNIGGNLTSQTASTLLSQEYGYYGAFEPHPKRYWQIWPRLSGLSTLFGSKLKALSQTYYYNFGDPKPYLYDSSINEY